MASPADAKAIASALGGEARGNRVVAPSPGHSDRDRGTVISLVPDAPDGLLVHSFNGADPLAVKDDLRRRGLLPERPISGRERARVRSTAKPARSPEPDLVAGPWQQTGVFEYDDGGGNVAYRVRRLERGKEKTFRAERWEAGRWVPGVDGLPRYPYRLTELRSALEAGDDPTPVIYLVEGEKKADKLVSLGFVGTCIMGGANGWRDEYAPVFGDVAVAILPDNDEPGRSYARTAFQAIWDAGGWPFIVELPGLPDKGDICDWRGTAEELRNLTAAAKAGPYPGWLDEANDNPADDLLPVVDPAKWQGKEPPTRRWALKDWVPLGQMTLLTGAGSTGKSLGAQQLATCIALGKPFLGVETRQAVSVYLTCEDDADELHRRQAAICEVLHAPLSSLGGKLHLIPLAGHMHNELATFDGQGRLVPSSTWQSLVQTVKAIGAGFVVLDNTAHLFAGDENVRNEVAAFANLLNGLAGEIGGAVVLLGHPNKAGDDYSGSTAWSNQVRSRLFLERPSEPGGTIPDPDARQLVRAKANYAQNGEALAFRWYRWAFVLDSDLPPDRAGAQRENAQASNDNLIFLDCLRERNRQQRAVSERRGPNFAPVVFDRMPESKRIGRTRLEAAMDRLFRLGTIERAELRKGPDRKAILGLRETA